MIIGRWEHLHTPQQRDLFDECFSEEDSLPRLSTDLKAESVYDRPVWIDLVERFRYQSTLQSGADHWMRIASFIAEQISSGTPFATSLTRDNASCSHLLMHTPQPMHFS